MFYIIDRILLIFWLASHLHQEIRKTIANNILQLRKEYGISRKALAKLVHIPEGRLRRLEKGDTDAKLYDFHIKRLGEVFGIPVDMLLGKQ